MKLRVELAELLVITSLQLYIKYLHDEGGKPVINVELLKSLYGYLKSALLFYKKILSDLKSHGFVINPYDSCVANKMINNKQFTVVRHVDDLKVSHSESS